MTSPAADVPIGVPVHGIGFGGAIGRFFRGYAVFGGRASRSEYWWAALAINVWVMLAMIIAFVAGGALILGAATQATPDVGRIVSAILVPVGVTLVLIAPILLPCWSIGTRRIRDAGFSGWLILVSLIPGGSIVPFVMAFLPSTPEIVPGTPLAQPAPHGRQPQAYGQSAQQQPPYGR